jgi:hypothetical protein
LEIFLPQHESFIKDKILPKWRIDEVQATWLK